MLSTAFLSRGRASPSRGNVGRWGLLVSLEIPTAIVAGGVGVGVTSMLTSMVGVGNRTWLTGALRSSRGPSVGVGVRIGVAVGVGAGVGVGVGTGVSRAIWLPSWVSCSSGSGVAAGCAVGVGSSRSLGFDVG